MIAFWLGLVLSSLLSYPIFRLLLRLNSRQKVSQFAPETHQAKEGTPTMGGLLFVVPLLLGAPLLASTFGAFPAYAGPDSWGARLMLFAFFAVIGFVDDFLVPRLMPGKRGLGWKQKLALQVLSAAVYAWMIRDGVFRAAIDIFIVLACANAYNFADGLDGLAASIGLLLIPGLVLINLAAGRPQLPPLLILLGGCMLPFTFLNAPKARVFMGDVGSLAVGALIGSAIAPRSATWPPTGLFPVAICLLGVVLAAELIPVPVQILWVKLFKRRLFPFTPIHHAFERAGWPETRVVAMFALTQLVCTAACISIVLGVTPGGLEVGK